MPQLSPTVSQLTPTERESYLRGRQHFEKGEATPALEAFSGLLRTRGDFADVQYMVGVLQDQQGDLAGAAESLREAIRLNPSYAEALLALATVCERRGDYARSEEYAERASLVSRGAPGRLDATTRGKLANLQAGVADAYAQAGELREAIDGYRKALDRCPDFHDIRYRLGNVLREAGLAAQAEREYLRVLRGNPAFLEARVQLGLTYYSLGRSERAEREWRSVLEQDPNRRDARMYLRLVGAPSEAAESHAVPHIE